MSLRIHQLLSDLLFHLTTQYDTADGRDAKRSAYTRWRAGGCPLVEDAPAQRSVYDPQPAPPSIWDDKGTGFIATLRSAKAAMKENVEPLEREARVLLDEAAMLAHRFHDTYEELAPQFGYSTRFETRKWDPFSTNGRLMVAVCERILPLIAAQKDERIRELERRLAYWNTKEGYGRHVRNTALEEAAAHLEANQSVYGIETLSLQMATNALRELKEGGA